MIRRHKIRHRPFRTFHRKDIDAIPQIQHLPAEDRLAMKAVSAVLPFRVNNYVMEELINWDDIPADPMFQLTFPQRGMLDESDLERMMALVSSGAPEAEVLKAAREIQLDLNPHPAGQMEMNVPQENGERLAGIQHKYRETVLFFPSQGQTCHAYCSYCFRWPQFVGLEGLKFASREADSLVEYLKGHPEVNSVLITGGDPLIMKTKVLRRYIEPLLSRDLNHIVSIRLGTKAPAYWPYRFVTDDDSDDLMRLFDEVRRAGRHLALMSHYSHPRELETAAAQAAVQRIQSTGAVVRCQAPLIRHVNDSASAWADMWRLQLRLGAIPYYMFVERDTGPRNYFEVPLATADEIFRTAYRRVSGLGRTVRGPSMSATPGKVMVEGTAVIHGEKVFVLTLLQGRNPDWVRRPFFAKFDEKAAWLDQLKPALGEKEFFYQEELRRIRKDADQPVWGGRIPARRNPVVFLNANWEWDRWCAA